MESKVDDLASMTGVTPDVARSYLEAAGGDVNAAAELIYDGSSHSQPQPSLPIAKPSPYPVAQKPATRQQKGGFSSLSDIKTVDPDDEKRDAYYAGGEKSGIAILDPNKHNRDELVDKVFESAQKHGAVAKHEMPAEEKAKFSGVGYTLGNTVDNSAAVAPKPKPQGLKTVFLTFWTDCFTVDDGPPRKKIYRSCKCTIP